MYILVVCCVRCVNVFNLHFLQRVMLLDRKWFALRYFKLNFFSIGNKHRLKFLARILPEIPRLTFREFTAHLPWFSRKSRFYVLTGDGSHISGCWYVYPWSHYQRHRRQERSWWHGRLQLRRKQYFWCHCRVSDT